MANSKEPLTLRTIIRALTPEEGWRCLAAHLVGASTMLCGPRRARSDPGLARVLSVEAAREAIKKALWRLSPPDREAVVWCYLLRRKLTEASIDGRVLEDLRCTLDQSFDGDRAAWQRLVASLLEVPGEP